MKLRPPQGERVVKRMGAGEALVGAESRDLVLEFDPKKIVPEDIWKRIDWLLKTGREYRPSENFPLLRLAEFDPGLRMRAQQDPDLAGQIQSAIYTASQQAIDSEKDIVVNVELARYKSLFPEVLDNLDDLFFPFPHDFQKSLDSITEYHGREFIPGTFVGRVASLLELFPEHEDAIKQKLKATQFWDKAIEETRELSHQPGQVLDYLPAILDHLTVLFPERIDEILEIARPCWMRLQEGMVSWGESTDGGLGNHDPMERPSAREVAQYVDSVFGMSVLAELSRKRKIASPQPLPHRLVA